MSKKRITIKDIAKLAGVSRGTVDRVINNRGKVDQGKKEAILKIVEELGYQKNINASKLALNKTFEVQIILPDSNNEAYWKMVKKGVMSTLSRFNTYDISINLHEYDLTSSCDYLDKLKHIYKQGADFIMIAPVFLNQTLDFLDNIPEELSNAVNRILSINSEVNTNQIDAFIGQDSYAAGRIAAQLFHKSIHTENPEILCITLGHQVENSIHIKQKIDGLMSFSKEQKLNYRFTHVNITDFQNEEIIAQQCEQIAALHPYFDGFFFTNSRAKAFIEKAHWFKKSNEAKCVIGFDLTPDNINYLKDGTIDYLLDEQPFEQGKQAMLNILDALVYKKEISGKRYLPINIIISENLEAYTLIINSFDDLYYFD